MTKQNQRQAVYTATMNVLAEHNVNFDDGMNVEGLVTKEMRAQIISVIVSGFQSGEVELSAEATAKFDTEQKLRTYTSGLVSNWYRKDRRLNGDVKHEAKNPGSRQGSSDEQLKALKAIRAAKADDAEAIKVIDAAIERRKSELATSKKPEVTEEQLAKIPAELRETLGL